MTEKRETVEAVLAEMRGGCLNSHEDFTVIPPPVASMGSVHWASRIREIVGE